MISRLLKVLESKENQNVTPKKFINNIKEISIQVSQINEIIEQILPKKQKIPKIGLWVAAKLLKLKDDQKAFENIKERLLRVQAISWFN